MIAQRQLVGVESRRHREVARSASRFIKRLTSKRLISGLIGAVAFLAMTLPRLDAQRAQYDELHQAAGTFAWCGRPTGLFTVMNAFGLPVLNMTYSGAIKTALFGLWLRTTGTMVAWRLTGLVLVAGGLVIFSVLSRARPAFVAWMMVLLITDATILLGTRHDYGPTALALTLRMVMLGLWLRIRNTNSVSACLPFAFGLCVGLAGFESSVPLSSFPFSFYSSPSIRGFARGEARWHLSLGC